VTPSRSLLLFSAVTLAGIAAFVVLGRQAPAPHPAASTSHSASAPLVSAAPPLPPWPDNPVTVDCAPFAPAKASAPAPAQPSAAGVLVAKTRSFGASAMTCGTGVAVTAKDRAELATALAFVARMKLSPIARAVLQNAALRLARCARAAG
jgi:hypothetical protein